MSRNAAEWSQRPSLAPTHYVDPRIYTDEALFEEEREKIFKKAWSVVCHESEVPNAYDYRRCQHISGKELLVVRGKDMKIRTFYNHCSHRGNLLAMEPSGTAKRITCMFHQWAYDTKGNCVEITRQKEGYQDRISKKDMGLREVKTEMGLGGFVWVNVDDNCGPLEEFVGDSLDYLKDELSTKPLEIISYHKAVVNSNYKLWYDTNSELYHDFLHHHNRKIALIQPGYWDRRVHTHDHGHIHVDSMQCRYDAYEGNDGQQRQLGWPGGEVACHKLIDLFPTMTFILRAPAFRLDTMVPLGPDKVIIEFRGFAIKGDSTKDRDARVRDHNSIWGPFGRNLPEDEIAIVGQMMAMKSGNESTYVLQGREEPSIQDEIGMRHYYSEWSQWMERSASDPFNNRGIAAAE
jgi:methanesulfonate monooxygenase large subunit